MTFRMKLQYGFCGLLGSLLLAACATTDLYEKVVPIPGHQWAGSYRPSFTFTIQDTTVPYQLFLIIRHNNQYNYNNIWLDLHRREPSGRTSTVPYELVLATNERGWLGIGMDDIYEHRVVLQPPANDSLRIRAGTYTFSLEQVMREDPLQGVLNVGIRLEKKNL